MTQLQIEPMTRVDSKRPRRWPRVLAALAGVMLCATGGVAFYFQRVTNWGVVEPGRIYRSAQIPRPLLRQKLAGNRIGLIIYLSNEKEGGEALLAEKQVAAELGIERQNYPLNGDGLGDPQMYTEALTAICQADARGKAVLVHCHSGAQRTGGVIAAYRMLVEHRPPQEAYAEMLRYGYDPKGNPQLVNFLNQHLGEWAAALRERGIIPRGTEAIPQITP